MDFPNDRRFTSFLKQLQEYYGLYEGKKFDGARAAQYVYY